MEKAIIVKFAIVGAGVNKLTLPKGAEILGVHGENRQALIMVQLDPNEQDRVERKFSLVADGQEFVANQGFYLGSAHFDSYSSWHVFEEL